MKRREKYLFQKRSLGQVFLTEDWPVEHYIRQLEAWHVQRALEIGPGNGILTRALVGKGIQLTAVEKDDRFAERLNTHKDSITTNPDLLEVVNADILKFDLENWISASNSPAAIVGNIPYNISSPLVLLCLQHIDRIKGFIFMTQLEFAKRLVAPPNNKDYGSLSVFAQLRAKIEFDCKVDRQCFNPIPKVDSAIVIFKPLRERLPSAKLRKIELVTRAAFTQRRKILANSLSSFLKDHGDANLPIDLNRRADSLAPAEFKTLAEILLPD